MAIKVKKATKAELPDERDHGFKVMEGDNTLMFFHWQEEPEGEEPTGYQHALEALPQRLEEMGYKNDVNGVYDEVVGMFGKE